MDNMVRAKADDIFRRWEVAFASKPPHEKTTKTLADDLDIVIGHFCKLGMGNEDIKPYVEDFIKAYLPSVSLIDHTYKKLKSFGKMSKSRDEFSKTWKSNIENAAWNAFYTWFPLDEKSDGEVQKLIQEKNKRSKAFATPDDEESSDFINREKRNLAAYAELFPIVTAEMVKKMDSSK